MNPEFDVCLNLSPTPSESESESSWAQADSLQALLQDRRANSFAHCPRLRKTCFPNRFWKRIPIHLWCFFLFKEQHTSEILSIFEGKLNIETVSPAPSEFPAAPWTLRVVKKLIMLGKSSHMTNHALGCLLAEDLRSIAQLKYDISPSRVEQFRHANIFTPSQI